MLSVLLLEWGLVQELLLASLLVMLLVVLLMVLLSLLVLMLGLFELTLSSLLLVVVFEVVGLVVVQAREFVVGKHYCQKELSLLPQQIFHFVRGKKQVGK
mmetsp:Transcript_15634/g.24456  ORF Transcript_15634/g.24456 Transcript_15634/m.24456 type:complete len:100 (+) Transcript_15634:173-472(+)